ncbi:MAG: hypothetical protein OER97_08950 [Gammaproteobacteria bacterium]|nr:hypothetical protein [Gammaproteobacteria bacterium]
MGKAAARQSRNLRQRAKGLHYQRSTENQQLDSTAPEIAISDPELIEPVALVVGVTGHRDLVESELHGLNDKIRSQFQKIQERYPHTPVVVLTPMAEGADLLIAEVAQSMDLRIVVPLPLPKKLYLRDFRSERSRRKFEELYQYANVFELPLVEGNTLEDVSREGDARNKQYAQVGVYVASHCHILLALWDGKPSDQLGGTAQIVEYHITDQLPEFLGGPQFAEQSLTEDENDLVLHIVCSRDRANGEPATPLQPLQVRWLDSDEDQPCSERLSNRYRRIFAHTDEFNHDALKYCAEIAREKSDLIAPDQYRRLNANDRRVNQLFYTADWLAIHYQNRLNMALRGTYVAAVLMGLSFILYADLPGYDYMVYAFLLFFGGGFALYSVGKKRHWHRKYLDYRVLAESLRVQFFWQIAGVNSASGTEFAHGGFLQKQDVELEWIRNVMRVASLRRRARAGPSTEGGLDRAIELWIGDPLKENSSGQIAYYARKASERTKLRRITAAIASSCLWAGIAVAIVLALFQYTLERETRSSLIVLMGILPLIAGVREAYAHKKAEKEVVKQYQYMHKIFRTAARRLARAETTGEKLSILKALGHAALDEHAEWILTHRERPLEHGKP